MRIALVGIPEAGKTVYMAGLYRRFSQRIVFPPLPKVARDRYIRLGIRSRAGLKVKAPDTVVEGGLIELGDGLARDPIDLPPPTAEMVPRGFELSFRFKSVADEAGEPEDTQTYAREVEFYDVPGAVVKAAHEQTASIRYELEACDVFMVFIPVDVVAKIIERLSPDFSNLDFIVSEIAATCGLGVVEQHITDARSRYGGLFAKRTYPVCFVLSKFDTLHETVTETFFDILYNSLIMPFTEEYEGVLACSCPVSVIDGDKETYSPFGLEWPFLFSAGAAILEEGYRRQADARRASSAAAERRREAEKRKEMAQNNIIGRAILFLEEGGKTADDFEEEAESHREDAGYFGQLSRNEIQLAVNVWTAIATESVSQGVKVFTEGRLVEDPREFA